MGSEKAWYWIAVGVLALLVTNGFAARHKDDLLRLAEQSQAAIEQASIPATRLMATAEAMLGRGESRFVRAQSGLAQAETRLASAQTEIECHQAAFARMQAEWARAVAIEQLRSTVICPRPNLRIEMLKPPVMHTHGAI
jgi:uncharacterized protein HemX